MRIALISLVVFLVACGSSNTVPGVTQADIQAAIAPLQAQIQSLQSSNKALTDKLSTLTLIGKVHGVANTSLRLQGEFSAVAPSFGPCTDMGVLIGFTNNNGQPADALSASGKDFKQCTGYQYAVHASDGTISVAGRIFWDGPNCTGNIIEWEAAGGGYSTDTLQSGVVFSSPTDGSILMVRSGQTPQPILIQSVWVNSNPGCQSDVETQLMYLVEKNDPSVSGVPDSGVGKFQLSAP